MLQVSENIFLYLGSILCLAGKNYER